MDQCRPYHIPTGQLCFPHNCFTQAMHNKDHAYELLNLSVVVGSLGIGKLSPFFEYGNRSHSVVKDFLDSNADPEVTKWDAHVWLESEAGDVYDIFTPYMRWVSDQRNTPNCRVRLPANSVIEHKSKTQLRKMGLHYVQAPEIVQKVILAKMTRDLGQNVETLRKMVAGGALV